VLSSAEQRPGLAMTLARSLEGYLHEHGAELARSQEAAKLVWPAKGSITSVYGPSHPLGIDIGQAGGPILAATGGTVLWAGGNACCSYGLYVIVDGPDGIRTLYAHLSKLSVKTGDRVRQGHVLGTVGCTGTCFGTHLHFEVFDHGRRQNPLAYLP
jgi:murein DD-endopeptidase MepM/ murein hydrolase activator NlpD